MTSCLLNVFLYLRPCGEIPLTPSVPLSRKRTRGKKESFLLPLPLSLAREGGGWGEGERRPLRGAGLELCHQVVQALLRPLAHHLRHGGRVQRIVFLGSRHLAQVESATSAAGTTRAA